MNKELVKSKSGKIIFIIIASLLIILVGNSFVRDLFFQFTKNETNGQILSIEKNMGFEPYKLKIRYYDYNKKSFAEYNKLISNSGKEKIENRSNVTVLYSEFVNNVYIKEDEYPMFFDFVIQTFTLFVLLLVVYKLIHELKAKTNK